MGLTESQKRKSRIRKDRIAKVQPLAYSYGYSSGMTLPTIFEDLLIDFFHLCDEEKVRFDPDESLKSALELYRLECADLKPLVE